VPKWGGRGLLIISETTGPERVSRDSRLHVGRLGVVSVQCEMRFGRADPSGELQQR